MYLPTPISMIRWCLYAHFPCSLLQIRFFLSSLAGYFGVSTLRLLQPGVGPPSSRPKQPSDTSHKPSPALLPMRLVETPSPTRRDVLSDSDAHMQSTRDDQTANAPASIQAHSTSPKASPEQLSSHAPPGQLTENLLNSSRKDRLQRKPCEHSSLCA